MRMNRYAFAVAVSFMHLSTNLVFAETTSPTPPSSISGNKPKKTTHKTKNKINPPIAETADSQTYNYPFSDALIEQSFSARYPLAAAQEPGAGAIARLSYSTINLKVDFGKSDHAIKSTEIEGSVAVAKKVVFAITPSYSLDDTKDSFYFDTTSGNTASTITSTTISKDQTLGLGVQAVILASPLFDIGLGTTYKTFSGKSDDSVEGLSSSSSTSTISKYSTNQFKIAFGAHSPRFEAALEVKPGVSYKKSNTATKSTSTKTTETTSDDDEYLPQEINLNGRYQVTPSGVFGSGYAQSTSDPETKGTKFGIGGGIRGSSLQADGLIVLGTKTVTSSNSTSERKISETDYEATIATVQRNATNFGASLGYATQQYKADNLSVTAAILFLGVSANVRF